MNKGLNSEHILLKLHVCESFFFITNGQLVCKMAQAQMCLSAEQIYTQKLEELIREKTECNIWNREKYEEIIHLISTEPKNEDKTNFYNYIIKK